MIRHLNFMETSVCQRSLIIFLNGFQENLPVLECGYEISIKVATKERKNEWTFMKKLELSVCCKIEVSICKNICNITIILK